MPGELSIAALVVAPFLGALLVLALRAVGGRGPLLGGLAVVTAAICLGLVAVVGLAIPRPYSWRTGWIDLLGIGLGLFLDDLSLLFAILVAGVSLFSLAYSIGYIPHEVAAGRLGGGEAAYYAYMLLFTGAMLGMVLAGDLVQLYVFWEVTGIVSFLLIGIDWPDPRSRSGAIKALIVTGLGGLALLLGLIILGLAAGSFALADALAAADLLRASGLFAAALLLILVGAATKSAQFPFHVWLPDAMVAPTPVSAFLHSAALVAAGVYLLARFHPVFAGDPLWAGSVAGVGLTSALVAGVLALKARELKRILAYSTISQYGFVFALLGYGTAGALAAALFSFFQHGVVKAGLFFAAGAITHATGAREIGRSAGLWRHLPGTAVVAVLLALSLGGLPPLAGFWMKEGFLGATLKLEDPALAVLGVAASALTFAYMLRFLVGAFVEGAPAPEVHRPPPVVLLAPGLLAGLTILLGLWPDRMGAWLAESAAAAILGQPASLDLALHLDLKLLLSLLALALGALAFVTRDRWAGLVEATTRPAWSLDRLYGAATAGLERLGLLFRQLQHGYLPGYLYVVLLGLAGLLVYSALASWPAPPLPSAARGPLSAGRGLVDLAAALVLLLIALGTVLTFVLWRHVHVVLALGAVGYLIGGFFALELAPDVALVQIHVETLVTVLFVLALLLVPSAGREAFVLHPGRRLTPPMLALALAGGLGSAYLSWLAIAHEATDPIAPWFGENAQELAHADDVVAAILVDFRALDTLGEITVFAVATVGVYALVRLIREEAT